MWQLMMYCHLKPPGAPLLT